MDRKEIEIMLKIAEEKKQDIGSVISSLHKMLSEIDSRGGKPKRRRKSRSTRIPDTANKIRECLYNSTNLLTPAEIHLEIQKDGFEISPAVIRNSLRRFKDELFESPQYGKWKLKGKQFENERKEPESDDDEDLPF